MTANQFNAAVAKLGLSVYAARKVLGVSMNQAYRYSAGRAVVPVEVERLLDMFVRFGVPAGFRSSSASPIERLLTMLVRYGVPGEWRK
jgi:hypothetical protein